MKTLMNLSTGLKIGNDEINKVIHFENFEVMVFGREFEEKAEIAVLYKENKDDGCFGVLQSGYGTGDWSLHLSIDEAMQLHALLPNVKFRDERGIQRKNNKSELANDWLNKNCLILDTETTGHGDDAEIVEISVIDAKGSVLQFMAANGGAA